jgi:hypothetical protein
MPRVFVADHRVSAPAAETRIGAVGWTPASGWMIGGAASLGLWALLIRGAWLLARHSMH